MPPTTPTTPVPARHFFAAVGDVHGHMNAMVDALGRWERATGHSLSYVLQVGDFEPHRDEADLSTMAAPSRYRTLGDFSDYARGQRRFPWPVYFIGGNHEPYGFLDRLPPGGEAAPNCVYLGRSGVTQIGPLTVAGLSGIFVADRFATRPSIEQIDAITNRAYIGFTEAEVVGLLEHPRANILVVHEWPLGIVAPEDEADFEGQRRSMRYDAIGNDYARMLMEHLEPALVLCGHMHRTYRRRLGPTQICALANVRTRDSADAYAFFRVEGTSIEELRPSD